MIDYRLDIESCPADEEWDSIMRTLKKIKNPFLVLSNGEGFLRARDIKHEMGNSESLCF